MFFYLYVGSIRFAPLKSQGLDVRVQYIQKNAELDPHAPPPCSPKVIHSLAVAVSFCPASPSLGFPALLTVAHSAQN